MKTHANVVVGRTCCLACRRMILTGDAQRATRLPVDDFCRPCGRPISERGTRLSDNAGFVAFAKRFTGRRPARLASRGNTHLQAIQ